MRATAARPYEGARQTEAGNNVSVNTFTHVGQTCIYRYNHPQIDNLDSNLLERDVVQGSAYNSERVKVHATQKRVAAALGYSPLCFIAATGRLALTRRVADRHRCHLEDAPLALVNLARAYTFAAAIASCRAMKAFADLRAKAEDDQQKKERKKTIETYNIGVTLNLTSRRKRRRRRHCSCQGGGTRLSTTRRVSQQVPRGCSIALCIVSRPPDTAKSEENPA